ncbi:molybdopterin-guanine dinucleotide biosynthesis protein B [Oceanibaculum pacificum]|uniref:Molybdopterin-guanine dinucleotide biosynthesis protein MobB n=1 Tax=Oceanibaculum pacificum TaxID=580166 RepID=A0A154W824_9PROT|nr:molybdopterin-guanine dinucleotide biosynthesis protein B [Oceanibaculum pacificum]KZD09684.1 molybdopterin-guanine dinucleotide biosynthesis protein MobB [Oceanibaculum pacificum]
MKIFGIAGWSGSGKTTLMAELLPALVRRGLRVSTVKHAHHAFDVDKPGKDSYRHREAGATEVMISSAARWALMHEHRGDAEPDLAMLIRNMTPVDLLLVEGFKHEGHPKLEVYRPSVGKPPLHASDPMVVAVASDAELPDLAVPLLPLNDTEAIARFIVGYCGLDAR